MRGRKFIKPIEDSLTGLVISCLSHLPVDMFWILLRSACVSKKLPVETGAIKEIQFWPRWYQDSNYTNQREPDVFISFEKFDLIIEAKRWDNGDQNREQWKNEFEAYHTEYGNDRKVYLLTIGGTAWMKDIEKSGKHKVFACKWQALLEECQRLRRNLSNEDSMKKAQHRILENVCYWLEYHGYFGGRWAKDFNFSENKLGNTEPLHRIFRSIRRKCGLRWSKDFSFEQYRLNNAEDTINIFRTLQGRY